MDANGEVWNTGRAKDLIIRSGHNIDALVIEDALQGHPAVELGSFDAKGRNMEIISDNPSVDPAFGGLNHSEIQTFVFGQPEAGLNTRQDYKRTSNGDESNNDTENFTATIDYDIGEYTLTSVTGYVHYEYDEHCDCDFSSASVLDVPLEVAVVHRAGGFGFLKARARPAEAAAVINRSEPEDRPPVVCSRPVGGWRQRRRCGRRCYRNGLPGGPPGCARRCWPPAPVPSGRW